MKEEYIPSLALQKKRWWLSTSVRLRPYLMMGELTVVVGSIEVVVVVV